MQPLQEHLGVVPRGGRDGQHAIVAARLLELLEECTLLLPYLRNVALVEDNYRRLLGEPRREELQLHRDRLVVANRVGRRAIDNVHEQPAPLNVAQKARPKPTPSCAPSSKPGMSAMTIVEKPSFAPSAGHTPRLGVTVVKG